MSNNFSNDPYDFDFERYERELSLPRRLNIKKFVKEYKLDIAVASLVAASFAVGTALTVMFVEPRERDPIEESYDTLMECLYRKLPYPPDHSDAVIRTVFPEYEVADNVRAAVDVCWNEAL